MNDTDAMFCVCILSDELSNKIRNLTLTQSVTWEGAVEVNFS